MVNCTTELTQYYCPIRRPRLSSSVNNRPETGGAPASALHSGSIVVPAQPPKNFTHGDILRWRRVGGLTLAEVQYEPGLRVRRHVHAHARFVLVLAGAITEIRGDETQTHGASTLLFRHVGVHPVPLARTFRRVHRMTFAGYVRQVRIEFARRELAVSGAPLGDIAVAAGFCDQSHFSRLFKRYTGQTPAEYRLTFQPR